MEILKVENITKTFINQSVKVEALKATTFEVKSNEFIAIIGPSGSGKSTLLTIIGALQTPSTGKVFINNEDLSKLTEKEKAKLRYNSIGFILQSSNLIPFLTIEDQFKLVDNINKRNEKQYREELMESLGIDNIKGKYIKQLSGGQRQRVAIARALYNNPTLLLADEPTASLDTEKAYEVISLLQKETKEKDRATIMVTHDTRMTKLCDKVYRMEDGVLSIVCE